MPNQLPVTIDFGTLPANGAGYTPQQLADILSANGAIFTEQAFALFTTGSTAPTSDTGPWAKDGNSWYYWDTGTGSYVPFLIPDASLKYYVGATTPDPTIYQFWIKLDGLGAPLGLFTYYAAAWTDVYSTSGYATETYVNAQIAAALASYSTTVDMNAAISAAVSGITIVAGQQIFKGRSTVQQDVVFAAPGTLTGTVDLGGEDFDPDNVFASNAFTATATGYYSFKAGAFVSTSGAGGGDTLDTEISFAVNGTPVDSLNNANPDVTSGMGIVGSTDLYLNSGDVVTLYYSMAASAAFTAQILSGSAWMSGFRIR